MLRNTAKWQIFQDSVLQVETFSKQNTLNSSETLNIPQQSSLVCEGSHLEWKKVAVKTMIYIYGFTW